SGPRPVEILARVAAQMGEPDRTIAALQKLLSIPYDGALAEDIPLTPAGETPASPNRQDACATTLRGVIVDLIFRRRARRERVRRSLCQRQLLLQKRKPFRRPKRIFSRSRVLITSNCMSATPSRPHIFTRRCLVFRVSPIPGRKLE